MAIPIMIYDILFLFSFLLVPISIYQTGWFPHILALFFMYWSLELVKKYRQTTIPTDGKAVLISGCDSGIGHALALQLHEKGFRVFAGCLFPEGVGAETLTEICTDNLKVVPLDVTRDESVKTAENIVRQHLQGMNLWGLVSNAGVYCCGDIELTPVQQFQKVFDVNVFGMLRFTKAFIPLVRKSKGRILVMSSIAGMVQCPSVSGYGASKVALESFSNCLRMEMVKFGIQVSIVQPSAFGAHTKIHAGANLTRLYNDADEAWSTCSDEVKNVYGKAYTMATIADYVKPSGEYICSRGLTPVIEATQDCLVTSDPPYRILVHGGKYKIDPMVVLWSVLHYCPTAIKDWFLCKLMGHSNTSKLQGINYK